MTYMYSHLYSVLMFGAMQKIGTPLPTPKRLLFHITTKKECNSNLRNVLCNVKPRICIICKLPILSNLKTIFVGFFLFSYDQYYVHIHIFPVYISNILYVYIDVDICH